MLQDSQIRRHADGSVDIDHYVRRGRALHGDAVLSAVRGLATMFARLVTRRPQAGQALGLAQE